MEKKIKKKKTKGSPNFQYTYSLDMSHVGMDASKSSTEYGPWLLQLAGA